jgi:hypothetical protein
MIVIRSGTLPDLDERREQLRCVLAIAVQEDGEVEARLQRLAIAELLVAPVALVHEVPEHRDVVDAAGVQPALQDLGGGVPTGVVDHQELDTVAVEQLLGDPLEDRLDVTLGPVGDHEHQDPTGVPALLDSIL